MMALQMLPLLHILLALQTTSTLSYPNPIYGTKRYGRSSQHRVTSYDPYTSYQSPQGYPINYYKPNPYPQKYPDSYYYPQETYQPPLYYPPPARTSKYEIYQAVLPYYYQETPRQAYYDYNDPVVDVQEEMLQEAEREEREETQPIGYESYYENDDGDNGEANIDDINAAFLQNLILTQMYQDSLRGNTKALPLDVYRGYEEAYERNPASNIEGASLEAEDETVKELKQLQKAERKGRYRNKSKNAGKHWTQNKEDNNEPQRRNKQRKQKVEDKRSNDNDVPFAADDVSVYYDRKSAIKVSTTASPSSTTTVGAAGSDFRGQKEEFQLRPATPVRNAFAGPVLAMMSKSSSANERKRAPSVYDTIKHLLDMEKSMENNQPNTELLPSMKKRIITPEESLTHQLTVLKKAQ